MCRPQSKTASKAPRRRQTSCTLSKARYGDHARHRRRRGPRLEGKREARSRLACCRVGEERRRPEEVEGRPRRRRPPAPAPRRLQRRRPHPHRPRRGRSRPPSRHRRPRRRLPQHPRRRPQPPRHAPTGASPGDADRHRPPRRRLPLHQRLPPPAARGEEPGLLATLLDNPLVLPGAGAARCVAGRPRLLPAAQPRAQATAAKPRSSKAGCSPTRSSAPAAASASTRAMRPAPRRR